jgi:ABC-type sugar transport system ATPase subunit
MPTLFLKNISKFFPGVKALQDVTIEIRPREIHALCGENGAGKSTLMNIISGNSQPDAGSIYLDEKITTIASPKAAFDLQIATVHQHLSLVNSLSVAENIFANRQPVDRWGMIQFNDLNAQTTRLLQRLAINIKPTTLVQDLSQADRQMVEIAKALSRNPRILILDEPTASLTEREIKVLFEILKVLRNDSVSIIYISHRLDEIFKISDRVSILKDGMYQGTFATSEISKDGLIRKMVGRDLKILNKSSFKTDDVLLSVETVSGSGFSNISFQLHHGEILGLAGLVGAGRSEIARGIFGIDRLVNGKVVCRGRTLLQKHPSYAIEEGVVYLTEDRKNDGLFQEMSIADNIIVASMSRIMRSGFFDRHTAFELASKSRERFSIATRDVNQRVNSLSGGNQQKVMIAKWLLTSPDVLMIDEPTHGIDIGAKYEIYDLLKSLAAEGKGILMISSELPELINLCDRILVIKSGNLAGELKGAEMTEEEVMRLAM